MTSDADVEIDEKEPEHVDVVADRKLLNPNFDKYIISTQDLPVFKQKLPVSLRIVEPSTDQWSRQEMKLFSMVQPVFFDMVNSNDSFLVFFFLNTNGELVKTEFDGEAKTFSKISEVALSYPVLPSDSASLGKDHFPVSMNFADGHVVFVADGYGRLLIYKTDNRTGTHGWELLDVFHLPGSRAPNFEHGDNVGYPFIISDVRTLSENKYEVLLISVFKRAQEEVKSDPEKTAFANEIHWLTFEIEPHSKVKLSRSRRFESDGNLELATFDRFAEHVIILSGRKPIVVFDSSRTVKKIRKVDKQEPQEVIYVWKQTGEDITVLFKLPGSVSKNNIKVTMKPKFLTFSNGQETLLDGELFAEIDPDGSSWTLEVNQESGKQVTSVEVILSKKTKSSVKWTSLVPEDKKGKEIVEIVEQQAHIPVEESTLNPNHLEDVDMTSDDDLSYLSWINGESDQVDKIANVSFRQILFVQQLDYNLPISLCIREDVDGILYDFTHSPIKHKYTFDAFGYVQAGKSSRRFTLCSPNGSTAAVVDKRNHVYVYYKGSSALGSTLRNTKDKKQITIAKQFVVSLIAVDEDYQSGNCNQDIVAAIATNKLAEDGHNITVFQADTKPITDLGKNIHGINLVTVRERPKEMVERIFKTNLHGFMLSLIFYFTEIGFYKVYENHADKFSEIFRTKYDLVIVDELFSLHGMMTAEILKNLYGTPYVIYSPTHHTSFFQEITALSRNYGAYMGMFTNIPESYDDRYQPSRFSDRLFSVMESASEAIAVNQVVFSLTKIPKLFNLEHEFEFTKFISDGWLYMSEHFDKIGQIMPYSQDTFGVGSHCQSGSNVINDKTLSKEWLDFVEDPTSKGTIYVAFGSTVSWDGAPEQLKNSLLYAFEELEDYRIIWSYNGEFPQTPKKHIKFSKWTPQAAILSHGKTKVFLTHGGLKSLKESLCSAVPVVLMPILAEQAFNAKVCINMKIGQSLSKMTLTKEKVFKALREVLENPSYASEIKKIREFYLDTPIPALDYGAHKISKMTTLRKKHGERLYDYGHEKLFKKKGMALDKFRYHCIDYIVIIGLLVLALK